MKKKQAKIIIHSPSSKTITKMEKQKKVKGWRKPSDIDKYRQFILDLIHTELHPLIPKLADKIVVESINKLLFNDFKKHK